MKPIALLVSLILFGCGDAKSPQRGGNQGQFPPQRGRVIDDFLLRATFTAPPQVEFLDFGGAVLTTLTVPLRIDEGDLDVMRDVFWESAKSSKIIVPEAKGCVPSLFGIDPKRGDFQLKLWGWDNVGKTSACEELIQAVPEKGFEMALTNVKWADIGLVKNFQIRLAPR